jgi:hypothetical protein
MTALRTASRQERALSKVGGCLQWRRGELKVDSRLNRPTRSNDVRSRCANRIAFGSKRRGSTPTRSRTHRVPSFLIHSSSSKPVVQAQFSIPSKRIRNDDCPTVFRHVSTWHVSRIACASASLQWIRPLLLVDERDKTHKRHDPVSACLVSSPRLESYSRLIVRFATFFPVFQWSIHSIISVTKVSWSQVSWLAVSRIALTLFALVSTTRRDSILVAPFVISSLSYPGTQDSERLCIDSFLIRDRS